MFLTKSREISAENLIATYKVEPTSPIAKKPGTGCRIVMQSDDFAIGFYHIPPHLSCLPHVTSSDEGRTIMTENQSKTKNRKDHNGHPTGHHTGIFFISSEESAPQKNFTLRVCGSLPETAGGLS